MNEEQRSKLVRDSVAPGLLCEKNWTNITKCADCNLRGGWMEISGIVCPRCGSRQMSRDTGKWFPAPKPWWQFFKSVGFWLTRKEYDNL